MTRIRATAATRRAAAALAVSALAAGAALATGAALLTSPGAAQRAHDNPGHPSGSHPGHPGGRTAGPPPAAATPDAAGTPDAAATPDARLAAALAPVLRHHHGSLAIGILDPATGLTATYHASQPFDTASIVKADILAVLLLQHQQIATALSPADQDLAAAMIEDSDNKAASVLWNAAEGAPGMEAGNAVLGLRNTAPAADGAWGLTTTTITDQLRLLTDLTSPHSPLPASARSYELDLMRNVEPWQHWGVTAAADPGTRPAVKNGWLPMGPEGQWIINSIGVIDHDRHRLLVAVLSSGQPSQAAGIRQVQAAAIAAITAITAPGPSGGLRGCGVCTRLQVSQDQERSSSSAAAELDGLDYQQHNRDHQVAPQHEHAEPGP